jgi:hypothetical protein
MIVARIHPWIRKCIDVFQNRKVFIHRGDDW